MTKVTLQLEMTDNGTVLRYGEQTITITNTKPEQLNMVLEETVVSEETRPKRKLKGPRKAPVKITPELIHTVKFMTKNERPREEIMAVTFASKETISRINKGEYDYYVMGTSA